MLNFCSRETKLVSQRALCRERSFHEVYFIKHLKKDINHQIGLEIYPHMIITLAIVFRFFLKNLPIVLFFPSFNTYSKVFGTLC